MWSISETKHRFNKLKVSLNPHISTFNVIICLKDKLCGKIRSVLVGLILRAKKPKI